MEEYLNINIPPEADRVRLMAASVEILGGRCANGTIWSVDEAHSAFLLLKRQADCLRQLANWLERQQLQQEESSAAAPPPPPPPPNSSCSPHPAS